MATGINSLKIHNSQVLQGSYHMNFKCRYQLQILHIMQPDYSVQSTWVHDIGFEIDCWWTLESMNRTITWLESIVCNHRRTGPVSFRGAEVSVARIFSPLLARKSSGFARMLHVFVCPKMAIWKIIGGLQPQPPPPPTPPPCTPIGCNHRARKYL